MVSPCIICGLALCKCRVVAPLIKCGSISLGEDDDILLFEPCANDVVCERGVVAQIWLKEERLLDLYRKNSWQGEESENPVELCDVICTWPLSWTDVTLTRLCLRRISLTCIRRCFFCNKRASSFESTHWGFYHFSFKIYCTCMLCHLQNSEEMKLLFTHCDITYTQLMEWWTSSRQNECQPLMTLTHLALARPTVAGETDFCGSEENEGEYFLGKEGKPENDTDCG